MPRRLLLALLALVAAPLVLLGWVSAAAMRDAHTNAEKRIVSLLQSRLQEIDQSTTSLFDDYARRIGVDLAKQANTIDALKQLRRKTPVIRQGLFVSANGQLLFPSKPALDDPDGIAMYAALPGIISGRPQLNTQSDSPNKVEAEPPNRSSRSRSSRSTRTAQPPPTMSGRSVWQVWYMDQGMQLILWLPRSDGSAAGVILERPRWAADLTALLPDTAMPEGDDTGSKLNMSSNRNAMPGFTALVDESKQIVYRWGDDGDCTKEPIASLQLAAPLSSWTWEFHNIAPLVPTTSSIPLLLSLAGVAVVLLSLGAYVMTGVQRQMRAARNRVSFAGQVSHELRTPLTNIRLYAELAETDLENLPAGKTRESIQQRLTVIDSESKRLGRLVSGVLEMIQDGKKERGPRLGEVNPNEVISETLKQFAPSFQKVGIEVHQDLDADRSVLIDSDLLEMVLVNLLSNVEKYAAAGQYVNVVSELESDELIVTVADRGPGVSRRHRATIFQPFSRLDDSINAPSGTGIGLAIARNAAKRHGGKLELIPTDTGACFQLRIPVADSTSPTNSATVNES